MRFFLLTWLLLAGCSEGVKSRGIQIGIDPNWYPLDFGPQVSYVNGFTEELLLDIAVSTHVDYVRHTSSPDNLMSGLQSGLYDAVLTSIPPHNFNLAKYDFSDNFFEIGPVLIVLKDSRFTEPNKMNGRAVGVIANDRTVLALEPYPDIVIRTYPSIPELLNSLVRGEIEGALLYRILASNYVRDLYSSQLKIVGKPLTEEGIRMIALKGRHPQIIKNFDRSLESMKKKKLQNLLQKYQLD